ncbi:PLC-like phosphodiesterase [Jackrogersella minutella]|nr:PLC-like phosphodiesterase [Jackrogersella minutella]
MALDSEPSLTSHPATEETPSPDEQTPLLKPDGAAMGDRTPAGIPAPQPRDDVTTSSSSSPSSASEPRRLPQAIAHRGYKVVAPENSMLAFRAAVEAGAHAIETDLHLSKDGVVVLSHDALLRRCFGVDAKVRDCEWGYLATLRTTREPAQPLATLRDLLEYLNRPGLEAVRVILDIKRDDDATEIVRRTAETLAEVPGIRPWSERVVSCCWSTEYVKLSKEYLPGFPIAHVGFSSIYARALANHVPDLSVSMILYMLAMPVTGWRFIRDMKRSGHPIYVWTVNDESWMEWSIRKELDGVITDDPKLFLEVCARATGKEVEARARRSLIPSIKPRLYDWGRRVRYVVLLTGIMIIYFFKHGLPSTQVREILGN